MKNENLISVVLPMYNAEKYIKESISSILNQTYSNLEIIVVDDCSTDNSYNIVKEINDNRIKLYRNEKNLKISKNSNFALSKAKGNFIARMDADDIALKERFEKQIKFLNENPHLGFCGTQIKTFGKENRVINFPVGVNNVKDTILTGSPFANPTTMFNRKRIKSKLFYDSYFDGLEDYELFVRLLKNNILGDNLPECLLLYRVTGDQISLSLDENGRIIPKSKIPTAKQRKYELQKENIRFILPKNLSFPSFETGENLFLSTKPIRNLKDITEVCRFVMTVNKNKINNFYSKQAFNKVFYFKVKSFLKQNLNLKNILGVMFNANIMKLLLSYKLRTK